MPSYSIVFKTDKLIDTSLGQTGTIELNGVDPINIEPRHSAMGLWSVSTVATDEQAEAVEDFATVKADVYIYVRDANYEGGETLAFRGVLHNTSYQEGSGQLDVEGEDAAYYLLAGSGDVEYQNREVADAIEDYWGGINGFNATVYEPDPQIIAENVVLQSADNKASFEELFPEVEGEDISSDFLPLNVTDSGIEHLQTCSVDGRSGDESNDSYSGGGAETLNVISQHSFNYTLPSEHLGIAIREGIIGSDPPEVRYSIGDDLLFTEVPSSRDSPGWNDFGDAYESVLGGDDTDSVNFVIEEETSGTDSYPVDLVVIYDKRFHDPADFDNEVHEPNGYLDNPREYGSLELESINSDAGNHIDESTLQVNTTHTDEEHRIQVTFDGDTWLPNDGTEDNTGTITVKNEDVATVSIEGRIRLSGHSPNGAQDATPRFGYEGQMLSSWELTANLSSLGVIEDQRFDNDHLTNLQELHSQGDYRFTITPTEDDPIEVESYQRGTQTRSANWHTITRSRNRTTEDYWNKVTIKGPRDEQTGERPVTSREDSDEISRVGDTLEKTRIRNDLETEADRSTVATQNLLEAVDSKDVTGEIEAAPTLILPGYRYYVEAWGTWVDLEELRFSDEYSGGNANLNFDNRAMLVDRLGQTQSDLNREKR